MHIKKPPVPIGAGGFLLIHQMLFNARAGFYLGANAGLGFGCCKGGHAEGQYYEGCGCNDYEFLLLHCVLPPLGLC